MNRSAIQRKARLAVAGAVGAMLLQACGGGGGQGGTPIVGGAPSTGGGTIIIGGGNSGGQTLQASATYAQQCAPGNTEAAANLRTASLTTEKNWIRSYMDEAYLWRDEVPTIDASSPAYSGSDVGLALDNYFQALKSTALTTSGKRRDEFSFTMSTREWNALSSGGVSLGYGIEWTMASPTPPRNIRVAYVEPGSAAANAGVRRGDTLVTADGTAADAGDTAGVAALNAALFPDVLGQTHSFVLTPAGGGTRSVSLASANVVKTPVPTSQVLTGTDGARVGYMVFNDHIAPAEAQLISAMRTFSTAGISDLVVDLRYNGGGFVSVARDIASLVGGSRSAGRTYTSLVYNSKRAAENNSSYSFNDPPQALGLQRVYVLAGERTCSASEQLVNGLRPFVNVVLVGDTTCGKPVGFVPHDDFCGNTYNVVNFESVNANGEGRYFDGLRATCAVAEDWSKPLGSAAEPLLATALRHADGGSCTAPAEARQRALSAVGGGLRIDEGERRSMIADR